MSAGKRAYAYDSLTISYIREVPSSDVAQILDDLSQDFLGVTVHRGTFRTAAGGIGVAEAAVIFIVGATAIGFFGALGGDLYAKTRDLLWDLYSKHETRDTPTGRFEPMSIVAGRSAAGIYFIYVEKLSRDEFMHAIEGMGPAAKGIGDIPGDEHVWWYEFRFDTRTQGWRLVQHEVDGFIKFRDEPAQ
jgi:hypothetical protein